MDDRTYLGELEQMVLWVTLRFRGEGYGATILKELNGRVDRQVSAGALYATLDRLESKGMIESRLADPDSRRGGRRKRYRTVTADGRAALERVRNEWMGIWEGLDIALGTHEP
jgi:PadR family transcriptional regulator PadR